jgi:hypothetical protein
MNKNTAIAEILSFGKPLIKDYPRVDSEGIERFVIYPVKNAYGKWEAADVLHDGYRCLPHRFHFDHFEDCLKTCLVINKFNGYFRKDVHRIVGASMDNTARLN